MRGKKRIALCAACMVGMAAFAACGVKNEVVNYQMPAEAITTITFFGNKYEPENVTVIEKIISDFMTENPGIRVSYESLKGTDYFEALEKRMDSGKGDDVFMVNHDAVLELGAQGRLADLSGLSSIPGYTDQMLGQMTEKMEKFMECRLRYLFSAFTAIRTFCGSTGKKFLKTSGNGRMFAITL
ncbi:ABC transporter substrate-binding protein [Christensenella minuta]|nr:ABC transporter substrate-binding protein [Christensenella minuta]